MSPPQAAGAPLYQVLLLPMARRALEALPGELQDEVIEDLSARLDEGLADIARRDSAAGTTYFLQEVTGGLTALYRRLEVDEVSRFKKEGVIRQVDLPVYALFNLMRTGAV